MATRPIPGIVEFSMPCTRAEGLAMKDRMREEKARMIDCKKRAFKPGYDNLMKTRYREGGN